MFQIIWRKANELVEQIELELERARLADPGTGIVKWAHLTNRAALDIIGLVGVDLDFKSIHNPDSSLNTAYHKVLSAGGVSESMKYVEILLELVPMRLIQALPTKMNASIAHAHSVLRDMAKHCLSCVAAKRQNRSFSSFKSILAVAVDQQAMYSQDLEDQVLTILAAGHETVGTTATWAVVALCRHPQIQTRLRHEVLQHFKNWPPPSESVNLEHLEKMPYLQAFCNEVLRLYPAIPMLRRTSVRDTSIMGTYIPQGSDIMVSPAAFNASRDIWGEEAHEFQPERWLVANRCPRNDGGIRENHLVNLTFSFGKAQKYRM
jgi:cytochrome P450